MTKPALGRIVLTRGIINSNGTDEHPAIITRVWGQRSNEPGLINVNLTVFPDLGTPKAVGTVPLYYNRSEAEYAQRLICADQKRAEGYAGMNLSGPAVAFWPDPVEPDAVAIGLDSQGKPFTLPELKRGKVRKHKPGDAK